MIADSCIEINSTPEDVYHHRRLRFDISNSAAKGKLCKFLKSPEIVEIFKRIHAGHHVDWNGHDMVGTHSGRTDSFQPAGASYPHRVSALIH